MVLSAGQLIRRRGINRALGWMELYQLVAGIFNIDAVERVAPNANLSLFSHEGAYGPRLAGQLPVIQRELAANPDTRQAVAFIGRHHETCTNHLPCTETVQFLIREGHLHTVVAMRSWDLLKGLPYDVVMFGGLAMLMARTLALRAGDVIVNAGSGHLYTEDYDRGRRPMPGSEYFELDHTVPYQWHEIVEWAHDAVHEPWPLTSPPGITYLPWSR